MVNLVRKAQTQPMTHPMAKDPQKMTKKLPIADKIAIPKNHYGPNGRKGRKDTHKQTTDQPTTNRVFLLTVEV